MTGRRWDNHKGHKGRKGDAGRCLAPCQGTWFPEPWRACGLPFLDDGLEG